MRKSIVCLFILCFIGVVVSVGHAYAEAGSESKGTNKSDPAVKLPSPGIAVDEVRLASELTKWGRQNKNPAAVALAAQILGSVAVESLDASSKETEGGEEDVAAKKTPQKPSAESLMAEAKDMCGNEKELAAIETISHMGVESLGGAVGGSKLHYDCVRAHTTDVYTITFRGGRVAQALVDGDGDTDLDLYVYDQNGNLIDSDTDYTDTCIAEWAPIWTGPFVIRIKNRGGVYNCYELYTN